MPNTAIQSGLFYNKFPYIATGSGPKTLVLFPQIRDAFEDIRKVLWSLKLLKRLSKKGHKVYIIGRRRSLAENTTTHEMAADYEKIFKNEIGSSTLIGISLGGLIAQHFAADYPQHVEKLVLAVTGYKIIKDQHKNMRKWISLAEQKKWKTLYLEIAYLMHTADKKEIDEWLSPMLNTALQNSPPDPSDFIVSMNASLTHDTSKKINRIKAKTLIIGGSLDILFPIPVLQRTAELIPQSEICLLENTGHGAFDEKKKAFDAAVFEFICRY